MNSNNIGANIAGYQTQGFSVVGNGNVGLISGVTTSNP